METIHFEKTGEYYFSTLGEKGELLGIILDFTGTYGITKFMLNQFAWRCERCGLGTLRKYYGEIIEETWIF